MGSTNYIEKGSQLSQQYILDNKEHIIGINESEVVLLDIYIKDILG